MTTYDATKINQRLSKARAGLVLDHPFLGSIALNMPMKLDENIPTACTNGKLVRFNPEFVNELTDEELLFVVAHEVMHPMFEHNYRRGGRDPGIWNKAGDYVINELLHREHVGKLVDGCLQNTALYDAGDGITDNIYKLIEDQEGNGGGGGGGGDDPMAGDIEEATGSEAEKAQEAAEWKVKAAQAAQAAKMMGKLSANMERFVGELLNPKVNWTDVLQRFMQRCRSETRSWARPSRRFMRHGIYMPSADGEALPEMVFCVDMSGSIGDDEANQYAAEVRKVHEDGRPAKLHIIFFSHEVCAVDTFGPDDTFEFKPRGGGGTAFSPCFEYIQEHGIDPAGIVFLTDLYCHDFGEAPDAPVLWVTNGREEAPFGEVIKM